MRYACFLPDGEKVSPPSGFKRPLMDTARELLKRGYAPDLLITTRAASADHISWVPRPIGEVAKLTVEENTYRSAAIKAFKTYDQKAA